MSSVHAQIDSAIDLQLLLTPLAGENPAGENLQYTGLYDELREARRSEEEFAQGEWQRDTKIADWRAVQSLALNALTTKTKDLQIAVWLAEALTHNYGFVGLRDSLKLIKELLGNFWHHLYPEIEEGDLEARANTLAWFDKEISSLIKQLPITGSTLTENYSYIQYEYSRQFDIPEDTSDLDSDVLRNIDAMRVQAEKENKITSEQWRKAKNSTPFTFYQATSQMLNDCWQAYTELDKVMDDCFGSQTPGLGTLKKAFGDLQLLIEKLVKEKQPVTAPSTNSALETSATSSNENVKTSDNQLTGRDPLTISGPIQSRSEALKRLSEIAIFFHKTEPHSPVAYLVERAVKWGEMPLEAWLKDVIKNNEVLEQLRETLGITE